MNILYPFLQIIGIIVALHLWGNHKRKMGYNDGFQAGKNKGGGE